MVIRNVHQGSAEWLKLRLGKVTGSTIAAAVSVLKRKEGESAERRNLKDQIIAEILTGQSTEHYVSNDMMRGSALEDEAREAYAVRHDVFVDQIGFVTHPTIARAGASPDGAVGMLRGLEIKVPKPSTHIGYILAGVLPKEYEPQVMWNLACWPEMPEWDFMSYCPDLSPRLQQFCITVPRNEERIAELEAGVNQFLAEVAEMIEQLGERMTEDISIKELERRTSKRLVSDVDDRGPEDYGDAGITDEDIAWAMERTASR